MALPFDVDPRAPRDEPVAGRSVAPGRLKLWRAGRRFADDAWSVHCLLGPGQRPKVIRGYGGWSTTAREGRRSKTTLAGMETPAYQIVLRLDDRRPRAAPVTEQMRNLERLVGWNRADDTPPPVLNFAANVAHDQDDVPENEWVCETFEWGDSNSTDRGTLLWQDATLTIGLFSDDAPKLEKAPGFDRKPLKVGWDLRDFARRYLGDAKRWKDVAELNRDNPRCPSTPSFKPKREVWLLVPPPEPKAKRAKRGRR